MKLLIARFIIVLILVSFAHIFSGCGYIKYVVYKAHWGITFKGIPSMSALNNLAPDESLIVGGRVVRPHGWQGPLLLIAVSNQYRKNETVAVIQIAKNSDLYMAFLPKGDYELLIFANLDDSRDYETDEVVGRASITVSPEQSISNAVLEGPTILLDMDHPMKAPFHVWESIQPTSYVYPSLDDKFFDPKHGTMGLFYPTELIYHNQGFIFGLEEYDPRKTTVLFVHGIAGTPRDWKFYAAGLDRNRYQPFFFFYPSGLQLDKLGALLAQVISYIGENNGATPSRKIILVAHSMGGLVALSAIHKLSGNGLPSYLKLYCSISTPYGGSDLAQNWATQAPAKVPAWLDIGAKSEFVQSLTGRPFPEELPFYLFFSYKTPSTRQPENSDGSVSIRSQLEPVLQSSARKVIGFNETHMGVLESDAARALFLKTLDAVMQRHSASGDRKNNNRAFSMEK